MFDLQFYKSPYLIYDEFLYYSLHLIIAFFHFNNFSEN